MTTTQQKLPSFTHRYLWKKIVKLYFLGNRGRHRGDLETKVSISSADYLSDTDTHPGIGAIDVFRLMRPATAGSRDRNRGVVKLPDSQKQSISSADSRGPRVRSDRRSLYLSANHPSIRQPQPSASGCSRSAPARR